MNVFDFLNISFALNMASVVVIGLLFFVSRGFIGTLVKARLFGKTPLLVARRDGKMDFLAVVKKSEILRSEKYGDYSIVPKTTYNFGGMRCGLVYESFAGTLTTDFLEAANNLDTSGIRTYDDMETIAPRIKAKMEEISQALNYYAAAMQNKKATKEQKSEAKKKIAQYKAYLESLGRTTKSIDVIRNFFLYNFNPNTWKATYDRAVSDMKKESKAGEIMKWVVAFAILAIVAALAYTMIMQGGVQSAAQTVGSATGGLLPDLNDLSGSAIK